MVSWLALAVSLLALAVAVASASYSRRQALAVEDTTWEANVPVFDTVVDRPHSGAAQLRLTYRGGPALDRLSVDLADASDGPLSGFGAGVPDGINWTIGEARVGDEWTRNIVQRRSGLTGGPPWAGGSGRLRLTCEQGRHTRELSADVSLPGQPWVY